MKKSFKKAINGEYRTYGLLVRSIFSGNLKNSYQKYLAEKKRIVA